MTDTTDLAAKAPEERRRRIIASAVEVIVEKGFSGTRVADIAERAGTSPALVVYHFGSLDNVLSEAVGSVENDFFAHYEQQLPDGAAAVERLRLTGIIAADLGPAGSEWVLWLEIWVRALRDPGAREHRAAMDAAFRAHVRRTIEGGNDEGTFACADPAASAVRLVALLDGLAVQVTLGDTEVPEAAMVRLWLQAAAAEVGVAPARFGV